MKVICWKCGKVYNKKAEGEWNVIQGSFLCSAMNDGEKCFGWLVSKKRYDEEVRKSSENCASTSSVR